MLFDTIPLGDPMWYADDYREVWGDDWELLFVNGFDRKPSTCGKLVSFCYGGNDPH